MQQEEKRKEGGISLGKRREKGVRTKKKLNLVTCREGGTSRGEKKDRYRSDWGKNAVTNDLVGSGGNTLRGGRKK